MPQQLTFFASPDPDDASRPRSVSEVTIHIRRLFERDAQLQDVWIEGEISNFKRAASGHLYFSLKDAEAQINCVMWKSAAARLHFNPAHGDLVLAHGKVSLYEPQGAYQLYADALQPAGLGLLHQQFELLKAKLTAEGLFDSERKRPLPRYPRKIGIVTSPSTAALQDVLNMLRRRYPIAEIVLSPTLVQGEGAPAQIIRAIQRANQQPDLDVLLIVRGGGSLEDLWCFNDEGVARALAASRIPTVSGVGHEIDFTLVDFASDLRAPTPSAAAEIATPDGEELRYSLRTLRRRMENSMDIRLTDQRDHLVQQQRSLRYLSPEKRLFTLRQRLDHQQTRLGGAMRSTLRDQRTRLNTLTQRLEAASPQSILRRGYAIVTREGDGVRMNSIQQAAPGTTILVQLQDGTLKANVKERTEHSPHDESAL